VADFIEEHSRRVADVTRGDFEDTVAAMIASIRCVPVLIIEAAVDGS
jgi:hypothetical protein